MIAARRLAYLCHMLGKGDGGAPSPFGGAGKAARAGGRQQTKYRQAEIDRNRGTRGRQPVSFFAPYKVQINRPK